MGKNNTFREAEIQEDGHLSGKVKEKEPSQCFVAIQNRVMI